MCTSSHAPSRKHPTTVTFTAHSNIVSPQYGAYFMSPVWQLKFVGDSWVFGKFVNPCSNFSLTPYTGYWKFPIWCVNKQVSNLFHKDGLSSENPVDLYRDAISCRAAGDVSNN